MKTYILTAVVVLGIILIVVVVNSNNKKTREVTSPEVTAKNVSAEETTITIPKDLPNDIPMYPEAILDKVSDVSSAGERNVTLTLLTDANIPDVVKWYRGALSADGWSVTDDKNVGGYILLKSEKENVTIFVQSAKRDEGTTAITERIRIKSTVQ